MFEVLALVCLKAHLATCHEVRLGPFEGNHMQPYTCFMSAQINLIHYLERHPQYGGVAGWKCGRPSKDT
jgi:hypothetical protein